MRLEIIIDGKTYVGKLMLDRAGLDRAVYRMVPTREGPIRLPEQP